MNFKLFFLNRAQPQPLFQLWIKYLKTKKLNFLLNFFNFFSQQPQKEDTEAATAAAETVTTPTETPTTTDENKTPSSDEAPKAVAETITETPKAVEVTEPEQPKVEVETTPAPVQVPTAAPIIVDTVTEDTLVASVVSAAPIIEVEEKKPEEEIKTPEPIVVVEETKPIEIVDDEKVDETKEETAEKIDEPKIEVKEDEEIKEILKEETPVEITDCTVNPPPPLPSNPPPSQVSVFAESAMSNSNDSPLAPETVLVDNKLEVLSEIPAAVSEEEIKEDVVQVPEIIAPIAAPVVEETIEKVIEPVVEAEIKPEIIETEVLPKEEEVAPIEAQPLEESSEDPKPEQIAETIALIEKASEETVNNLDETLPPPPPEQISQSVVSDTEEQNITVDVSSPLPQNSLESLPSPPLSSSQSENLPPPPPATNEETTTTTAAASSSLPSPPLSDSSLPAEKSDEIISELPAPTTIVDEIKSEIIPEIAEILPHVNGNGIKEEDGVQQQQKDKVNNPDKKNQN